MSTPRTGQIRYFTMSPALLRFFSLMKKKTNTAMFSSTNEDSAPKLTKRDSVAMSRNSGRTSETQPIAIAANQGVWNFGCTLPNARGITPSRPME